MKKKITLFSIALFSLGLLFGYIIISEKITNGNEKIIAGKKQLEQGEQQLAQGKTKLSNGQQELSHAKNGYNKIKTSSYLWMPILSAPEAVLAVTGNRMASNDIKAGNQQVEQGNDKIKKGEEQLANGKLELQRGETLINLANKIRIACLIGSILFAVLWIVLVLRWRR